MVSACRVRRRSASDGAMATPALLAFVALCLVDLCAATVNWQYLTAQELAALPVSDFASATAADLHQLQYTACAGFSGQQLTAVTPDAFTGIDNFCVGHIPAGSWQHIAHDVLAVMTGACHGFTKSQIQQIPAASFSGFTNTCLQQFQSGASGPCAGLTASQLAVTSAAAIGGLGQFCVAHIPPAAFASISATTVSGLTGQQCAGFGAGQLTQFNPPAFAGWQLSCAQKFQGGSSSPCGDFTAPQLKHMNPSAAPGLGQFCIDQTSGSAWGEVPGAVVAQLAGDQCQGFGAAQIDGFNPAAFGSWTKACTSKWQGGQGAPCTSFTTEMVGNLTAAGASGLGQFCIDQSGAVWGRVSASVLGAMTGDQCNGFEKTQMASVNAASFGGWRSGCTAKFQTGSNAPCAGFMPEQIAHITPAAMGAVPEYCLSQMPSNALSKATQPVVAALTSATCGGLTAGVLQYAAPAGLAGLQPSCASQLIDACAGFRASLSHVPMQTFNAFQSFCLSRIVSQAWTAVSAKQIGNLDSGQCQGLTNQCTAGLPAASFAGFTQACVKNWQTTQDFSGPAVAVSAPKFAELTPSAVGGFSFPFARLPSSALEQASPQQIAALSADACQLWPQPLLHLAPSAALAGITTTCLNNLRGKACAGFTEADLTALPAATYAGFASYCIAEIPAPAFTSITAAQVSHLGANDQPTCSGLTAEQVATIPVDSFAGVQAGCAGWIGDGCGGLDTGRWAKLDIEAAVAHLAKDCAARLPDPVLAYIPLRPALVALRPNFFAGLSGHQVSLLYSTHQAQLLSTVSVDQAGDLPYASMQLYKSAFPVHYAPTLSLTDVSTRANEVSSLQVCSLTDTAVQDATMAWVCSMQAKSFSGWRGAQVVLMKPEWFSNFTASQLGHLYSSANITAAQMAKIPPAVFRQWLDSIQHGVLTDTAESLSTAAVQAITAAQFQELSDGYTSCFWAFTVEQLKQLTPAQLSGMGATDRAAVKRRISGYNPPPPHTNDDDHTTDDDHHTTHDDDTTVDDDGHPHRPGSGGLGGGAIAGIVLAVLAVMAAAAFGWYYVTVVKPRQAGAVPQAGFRRLSAGGEADGVTKLRNAV